MLAYLRVCNMAVIRDVDIVLGAGLNVFTGETGAGKSILVDAVGLLLGGRADASRIRQDAERGIVEGQFQPVSSDLAAVLREVGIPPCDEDGMVVRRELRRLGPNRTFVNGSLTPLAILRRVMAHQVALHGQNAHLTLASREAQGRFFDTMLESGAGLTELAKSWADLRAAADEQAAHERRHAAAERQLDLLRHQLDEIEAVRPERGEDTALEQEAGLLATAVERAEHASRLLDGLVDGENSVTACLARRVLELEHLATLDPRLVAEVPRLREVAVIVDDSAAEIRASLPVDEIELARLEDIQNRLAALQGLARKYGGDLDAVLDFAAGAQRQVEELEDFDGTRARLTAAVAAAAARFDSRARQTGQVRRARVAPLVRRMGRSLADLGLRGARFEVALAGTPPPAGVTSAEILARGGPTGYERAEFLFTAHAGESPLPMAKVASGGELSRLMLALHLVRETPGHTDGDPTFIFDEVDAGIGGEQAAILARELRRVAARRQVICVTHLPQVAASADRHLRIVKVVRRGRGETSVSALMDDERVEELARMLGGAATSETAMRHAAALVAAARRQDPTKKTPRSQTQSRPTTAAAGP